MRSIFSKLLAGALLCSTACFVGCKDYDDEIDGLNDRIDQMEKSIVLKTDHEALKATLTALESSSVSASELTEALKAYAKPADITTAVSAAKSALNDAITSIQTNVSNLQSSSASHQTAEQVASTVESMLTSYKTWVDTENYIKDQISAIIPGRSDAEVEALLAKYVKTSDLHEAILGWTGEELKGYLTKEDLKGYLTKEDGENFLTKEDGENLLTKEDGEDLLESLKKDIIDALTGEKGTVTIAISDLQNAINALKDRVSDLEKKTQIQSIVWIPETQVELQRSAITFDREVVYRLSSIDSLGNEILSNVTIKKSTLPVRFKVVPAAAAKNITVENLSVDIQKMRTTRGESTELISINSVKGDDTGVLTVEFGIADYIAFVEMVNNKVYADREFPLLSLNVSMDGVANTASNYIDVKVNTTSLNNLYWFSNFAYGNMVEEQFTEVANNGEVAAVYNNVNEIITLPAGLPYLTYNKQYYALPEGFEFTVSEPVVTVTGKDGAVIENAEEHLTLGNNDNGYFVKLDGSEELIGSTIELVYTLKVKNGEFSNEYVYTREIKVAEYPEDAFVSIEPIKYSTEFDGENYEFLTETTFGELKDKFWAANKAVYEPYGYGRNTLWEMFTAASETESEFNLALSYDASTQKVKVVCKDEAAKAWVGQGVQKIDMVLTKQDNPDVKVRIPFEIELKKPEVTLNANPIYVVNGEADAYASWANDKYLVEDKPITNAYITTTAGVKLVYTIDEDLTGYEDIDKPVIVDGKLVWNKWNGLTINVKVSAYLENNAEVALASETFKVSVKSPVGELKASSMEVASRESSDKTIDIASLFSLNRVGEGVNAEEDNNILGKPEWMTAVGGKITYEIEGVREPIVNTNNVLSFKESALQLKEDLVVTIKATFVDTFTGSTQTATATVTLTK